MIYFNKLCLFFILCNSFILSLHSQGSEAKKLKGKWLWHETTGGFAAKVETPITEGYSLKIEFSTNSNYRQWKENKCINHYRFQIKKGLSVKEGEEINLICFTDKKRKEVRGIPLHYMFKGNDTLILTENVFDGLSYLYVRMTNKKK